MIPKRCRLFGQDHAQNQRESRALSVQPYRKTLQNPRAAAATNSLAHFIRKRRRRLLRIFSERPEVCSETLRAAPTRRQEQQRSAAASTAAYQSAFRDSKCFPA